MPSLQLPVPNKSNQFCNYIKRFVYRLIKQLDFTKTNETKIPNTTNVSSSIHPEDLQFHFITHVS